MKMKSLTDLITKWVMVPGHRRRDKGGSEAAGRNDGFTSSYLGHYVFYILSKESLESISHM